jgi:transcriptional regulator with XRE-family HTH domain
MTAPKKDALSKYIKSVMDERGLRIHDVKQRAAGDITESYIGEMLRGSASNPSVSKLRALARGLGVDAAELFKVAAGMEEPGAATPAAGDIAHSLMMLDMMRKIVTSPDLVQLMSEIVRLSYEDIGVVYRSIKSLNDATQQGTEEQRKSEVV